MFEIFIASIFAYVLYKSIDKEALKKRIEEIDE